MRPVEIVKYLTYRTPVLNRMMAPDYPYKIDPGELCVMVQLIDRTREAGGAVVEIGVAQGDTSVFLLEHLRTVGDDRRAYFLDTFSGFTAASIDTEVSVRGKSRHEYDRFRYGSEARFEANLRRLGYDRFEIVRGDASRFDWSSVGPIGAVLLDIDLYAPTKAILEAVYPLLCSGGGIVVDDCIEGTPWDGSLQAYQEFIAAHDLPFERVGRKGAVVRKQ